uniref:Uncharacterized protein n=1 Tax=Ananas comosus var. bracteatus TaxID=296719 RepID=A0A6V7QRC9_ANACO
MCAPVRRGAYRRGLRSTVLTPSQAEEVAVNVNVECDGAVNYVLAMQRSCGYTPLECVAWEGNFSLTLLLTRRARTKKKKKKRKKKVTRFSANKREDEPSIANEKTKEMQQTKHAANKTVSPIIFQ